MSVLRTRSDVEGADEDAGTGATDDDSVVADGDAETAEEDEGATPDEDKEPSISEDDTFTGEELGCAIDVESAITELAEDARMRDSEVRATDDCISAELIGGGMRVVGTVVLNEGADVPRDVDSNGELVLSKPARVDDAEGDGRGGSSEEDICVALSLAEDAMEVS